MLLIFKKDYSKIDLCNKKTDLNYATKKKESTLNRKEKINETSLT